MAAKYGIEKLTLEQLEREITCGICQDHYTEPKALPCLHYYCKQCIVRLAFRTGRGRPFSCPECRSEATLPEGGVDELKSAFFIECFKSMFSSMKQGQSKVKVSCESCVSRSPAESFCQQCFTFLCKDCSMAHQVTTATIGHELVDIQDLNKGSKDKTTNNLFSVEKCPIHGEDLKYYCFHCEALVCRECTSVYHRDHDFQLCAEAALGMKEELLKELAPLRQIGIRLSQAVKMVTSTRYEVETQGEGVAQTINSSFDELVQFVQKRRRELLEEARTRVQEKVEKLTVQEKALSQARAEVQNFVEYTERCVKNGTSNEVMTMSCETKARMQRKSKLYNSTEEDIMAALEEVDVGVDVSRAADFQQVCQGSVKICQLAIDPARCKVKGDGLKIAELNRSSEVTVTANRLTNNQPTRRSANIIGHLKSLYGGSISMCDVVQMKTGEYCVQYVPSVHGRHELSLSVNEQSIIGSPFPVFVATPPALLGAPIRVLSGLHKVSGLALNSSGETVVASQNQEVITFFEKGVKVRSIGRDTLKLDRHGVVGIAIDKEDFMYLTLYDSNAITKVSKEGNIVEKIRAAQATGHLGVAVVGEEVMVCPRPSEGTITIYDRKLRFCDRITISYMGQFRDISADSKGILFVTDWGVNGVRVLNRQGDLLWSFGFGDDGRKLLSRPVGISAAGQFVYVCNNGLDSNDHSVHVFTVEGDHVKVLGCKGNGHGEFIKPYAVCVDREGFVYVSDFVGRVQVF